MQRFDKQQGCNTNSITLLMGGADYGDKMELARIRGLSNDVTTRFNRLIKVNRCQ